jgi:hypothetical protein
MTRRRCPKVSRAFVNLYRLMVMIKSNPCFYVLLVAGSLSLVSWAAELPSQRKSSLELTIEGPKSIVKSSEGISFAITFHNHSTNSLLLNGGELLGNGSEIWSSLEAELKSETGQWIPMTLGWGVPGVAGRIYFLGVPLRAGSGYKLSVSPHDYLIGNGERLKPGKYEVRCVYRGRQSPYRDSTQMPACWEGEVQSNPFKFEVLAE